MVDFVLSPFLRQASGEFFVAPREWMMTMKDMPEYQAAEGLDAAAYPMTGGGQWAASGFRTSHIQGAQALVISKHFAGLSAEWVEQAREVVKTAAEGGFGEIKFLVFDL